MNKVHSALQNIQDKFPKAWLKKPNEIDILQDLFDDFAKLGVWSHEKPEHHALNRKLTPFSNYIWPHLNKEDLVLAAEFNNLSMLFDECIESVDMEMAKTITERFTNIFYMEKLEDNHNALENLAFVVCKRIRDRAGTRIDLFNLLKGSVIDYFDSIIPFKNIKNLEGEPEMELFYFLRRNNIGLIAVANMTLLLTVRNLNIAIFLDPIWVKLLESISIICSLYNDLFSYEKEVKEKDIKMNSFHFLQRLVIETYIQTFNDQDKQEINEIFDHLHDILNALLTWPLQSERYQSPDSIFKELRKEPTNNHSE
ncbi:hypothetical protein PPL_03718 [Heterostelium album PN500]|uniref:Terpene synthase n=1 Tax=Heterostelium pallidum (strain ATCC 26659 / Pp 5 / PN500) TaxID=670386 RepID=D3B6H0_HETP5|nr:hypothetical protein PPL_03718 [Heterostelium album PN500]EFA82940.1 hypothetical protein PPL_03718 [Heterostelium album PN500]|eukprot:XP_020435057.1 hypothetical protein PPL_03718 [Heterostelium album PN500]